MFIFFRNMFMFLKNVLMFFPKVPGRGFYRQTTFIKYSTEIDDETLTIPDTTHGTYELQIVIGNYIFYTKVTLP